MSDTVLLFVIQFVRPVVRCARVCSRVFEFVYLVRCAVKFSSILLVLVAGVLRVEVAVTPAFFFRAFS